MANFFEKNPYLVKQRDKNFPPPPVPPSENLDRFQWWNPLDWGGMHEEEQYQEEKRKYERDLKDLKARRKPEMNRIYMLPHIAPANREAGDADYFVYMPPKAFTKEDQKKYPQGGYVPVYWNKRTQTAGRARNWKDNIIPHTTDEEGIPNTGRTALRVGGGGEVKQVMEPRRDLRGTDLNQLQRYYEFTYPEVDGEIDWGKRTIKSSGFEKVPVDSGAFNQYIKNIRAFA